MKVSGTKHCRWSGPSRWDPGERCRLTLHAIVVAPQRCRRVSCARNVFGFLPLKIRMLFFFCGSPLRLSMCQTNDGVLLPFCRLRVWESHTKQVRLSERRTWRFRKRKLYVTPSSPHQVSQRTGLNIRLSKLQSSLRIWTCSVNTIHPAPEIHEHFMIHKGYGTLCILSCTISTILRPLWPTTWTPWLTQTW